MSQCYLPFIEMECYLSPTNSFSEQWEVATERHIQQWGFESSYLPHFYKEKELINSSKYKQHLDSIYNLCVMLLIDSLGKQHVCDRMELVDFRHYSTKYQGKLIRGEFEFMFYYFHPRSCWNDSGARIKFTFEEIDSLVFELTMPEHMPDCHPDQNCQYISLSNRQWIDLAIKDGFIDGTEEVGLSNHLSNFKLFTYSDGVFRTRQLFYSLKTGEFVRDTFINQLVYWRKDARQYFRDADLIVDAKCIRVKPDDTTQVHYAKNYYFEVNHLLKGTIGKDTIVVPANTSNSHSISMSDVGKRTILYLNKTGYSADLKNSIPFDSTKVEIWYPHIQPTIYEVNNHTKFYTKLLPSVTDLDSVKVIKTPAYIAEEVYERRRYLNNDQLKHQKGLLVKIDNEFRSFDNTKWISHLYAFSCGDFTYPTELTFNIKYDSTITGTKIVEQGLVLLSPIKMENSDADSKPERTLSDNYHFELSDIEPDVFCIKITSKRIGQLCQLPVKDGSKRYEYKPVVAIAIDVEDPSEMFRLDLHNTVESKGKYYNPLTKEIKAYDYTVSGGREFTIMKSRTHKIDSILYKSFSVGDTITVLGKHLLRFKNELYHPCSKRIGNIEIRRHCKISLDDIIEYTENKIRYVVRKAYTYNPAFDDPVDNFEPTSGTVKVRYLQSEYVEQKLE